MDLASSRHLRGRRLLTLSSHGVNDAYFFLLPLVLPVVIRDLGVRLSGAGLLVSVFLFLVAVSSFFSGRGADRLASFKLIAAGFLVAAGGVTAAALSRSPGVLMAAFALAGLGVGTFHPSAYAQFDRLALSRTGSSFALFELWGSLTLVVIFFTNGTLLGVLGWRGVLLITGVLGVLMAGLYVWSYRGGVEDMPGQAAAGVPPAAPHADRPARALRSPRTGPPAPFTVAAPSAAVTATLLLFLLSIMLRFLSVMAVVNFLPTYLALERGLAARLAAYTSGILFVGGALVCPLVGRGIDRFGSLPLLVAVTAAIGPLLLLLSLPLPLWYLAPLLLLLGGAVTGAAPVQNTMLSALASRLGTGAAFGSLMGLMALVASVSPLIVGFLGERIGLARSFRLLALPAVLALGILALMVRVARPAGLLRAGLAARRARLRPRSFSQRARPPRTRRLPASRLSEGVCLRRPPVGKDRATRGPAPGRARGA
jgi:FSR family fosmidomycin resistance protein-like MFS transporter